MIVHAAIYLPVLLLAGALTSHAQALSSEDIKAQTGKRLGKGKGLHR